MSESPVYSHVTRDAIQNYGDDRFNNWFARRVTPLIGVAKTTIVGRLVGQAADAGRHEPRE
jgi:hypothetical protein